VCDNVGAGRCFFVAGSSDNALAHIFDFIEHTPYKYTIRGKLIAALNSLAAAHNQNRSGADCPGTDRC
jgi:hypothetical protein